MKGGVVTPRADPRSRSIGVALFGLTALLFARACANGFVNYDDPDYVTANVHVRAGLSWRSVRWAFTSVEASNWHPLTWLSHLLDVTLFGLAPAGHHATSVLLHALNAALAFAALRTLTGATWRSALVAALFAWHPLRVESVAWVAERKDVLSGTFFFLTLWAYGRYAARRAAAQPAVSWYGLALAAYALGLLAKPMLVTVPFVLLLLDGWPLERYRRSQPVEAVAAARRLRPDHGAARPATASAWPRLLLEKLPFLFLSGASCAITYFAQQHGGAVSHALPFGERSATAVIALVRYVGLFICPIRLSVLYPHPGQWPAPEIAGAVTVLVAGAGLAWWQRRSRPWIALGLAWFAGMLVPVLGLVQVGLQSIADRYLYLPGIGLAIALVWSIPATWAANGLRRMFIAAMLAGFGALTFGQIGVWKNSITLFTQAIDHARPGNYLAYDNRGIAWQEQGESERAAADYRASLAIRPDYPNAANNLARLLAAQGRFAEAIPLYRRAAAADPSLLEVHNNLANALADAGQSADAIAEYQFVLRRQPDHVNALNGYAATLAAEGRIAEAEPLFRRVLQLDPANQSASANLANVYALQGRRAEAERIYRDALAHGPDSAQTRFNLGALLAQEGRFAEAADALQAATRLQPLNPDAHALMGYVHLRQGQRAEALRELEIALQQRPNFPQARAWLQAAGATSTRP